MATKEKALYRRIADDLRTKITNGSLPSGHQLPTETELAEHWRTTRSTAVQGLRLLVHEGLIIARRPRGYFVRSWDPMVYRPQAEFRQREPNLDIFRQRIRDEGEKRETHQDIDVSVTSPTKTIQDRLQVEGTSIVAARRRVRWLDGEPYNTNDSYVLFDLAQGTDWISPQDIPRGTNEVLSELGREIVYALDEVIIRMPQPDETQRLAIPPGTPLAEHIVTGYDKNSIPVQVTINLLPGDRHVVVYERQKHTESGGTK